MKTKLASLTMLLCALWFAGVQLPSLQRAHAQFKALNSYLGMSYADMIGVIGPPDVEDEVKGIIEWWSLGTDDVAFDYFYPSWEKREKPSGLKILFRTPYGHRRCLVDRRSDLGFINFVRFYWLDCTAVIKKSDELKWRDKVYRDKMSRLSAQPAPSALVESQAQ